MRENSKKYRVELTANLAAGIQARWMSQPIQFPKGRQSGTDKEAEAQFLLRWRLDSGGGAPTLMSGRPPLRNLVAEAMPYQNFAEALQKSGYLSPGVRSGGEEETGQIAPEAGPIRVH